MSQKFTFQNPNGPEFVPVLGNRIVNPGDVVEFPDDYVIDPSDKWVPVVPLSKPATDAGGDATGA